jgi:hypothetical protein
VEQQYATGKDVLQRAKPLVNVIGDGRKKLVDGLVRNLLRGRPIFLREFNSPEVRAGREEFDADASALVGGFADEDDPALLLFIRRGIIEHELRSDLERLLKVEEAAMGVDDDRLAVLAEFAAVGIAARGADGDAREDSRTTALGGAALRLWHNTFRLQCERE